MDSNLQLIIFLLLTIAFAIWSAFFVRIVDFEYEEKGEFLHHHPQLNQIINTFDTPNSAFDEDTQQYHFGRYDHPIKYKNLHSLTSFQTLAQLKEFAYTAVADEEWFIGSALLQFHYTTAAIVYIYNTKTNESLISHLEIPILSVLGTWFDEESSAINGCVWWNGTLGLRASKCYQPKTETYDVHLNGKFKNGSSYDIRYSMALGGKAMSMIFPIGPKRPALVTKYAGAASHAILSLDGRRYQLSQPLAMMDWTRGLLRRLTYWHWCTLSWAESSKGRRYGLHLSEGTYDDANDVSLESTLWINDQTYHINSTIVYTQLTKGVKPYESDWSVISKDKKINLNFCYGNAIKGSFHYFILDGDLFHMWGLYSGTIEHNNEIINLKNVPGTLEDHYALW